MIKKEEKRKGKIKEDRKKVRKMFCPVFLSLMIKFKKKNFCAHRAFVGQPGLNTLLFFILLMIFFKIESIKARELKPYPTKFQARLNVKHTHTHPHIVFTQDMGTVSWRYNHYFCGKGNATV